MSEHDTHEPPMAVGEKQHMFDNPANVKRVLVLLYAACALLLLADFVLHRHIEHPLEERHIVVGPRLKLRLKRWVADGEALRDRRRRELPALWRAG